MSRLAPPRPVSLINLDRLSWPLLGLLLVGFAGLFTAMAQARLSAYRQGFDLVSFVQPIWNTASGRPFEQSIYAGTSTILGVDLFLVEGLIAPLYALWPSYGFLFGLLSTTTALGGLAIFLIAVDATGSRPTALLCSVVYLAHLTLQNVAPNEFRPRLIAATALLFAFWFQQHQRVWPFWLMMLLALSVRLDVALVAAMLGLYGLLQRRHFSLSVLPAAVGILYWLVGLLVIVPLLRQGAPFHFLFYFGWLGATPGEILMTLLTRPDYVLAGILQPAKLLYLLQLLWPVAGLALLRPTALLPALPSLGLNLLGSDPIQYSIVRDYSVLIVPWVMVASILTIGDLAAGRHWLQRRLGPTISQRRRPRHQPADRAAARPGGLPIGHSGSRARIGLALVALMLVATASQHALLGSPLIPFLRGYPPYPRASAAQQILAQLPPTAPAAITNLLAAHVPLRRQLYFFPGNRAYASTLIQQADWIVGDRRAQSTLDEAGALDRLVASGAWRVVAEADGLVLLERIR